MRPRSDASQRIVNWHDQHYANGVAKNQRTSQRFKRAARILKRLRDDMKSQGSSTAKTAAENATSFLLESLAYNVSDGDYEHTEIYDVMRAVVASSWRATKEDASEKLVEVSELKWLFANSQAWTKSGTDSFLLAAWQHVAFKN